MNTKQFYDKQYSTIEYSSSLYADVVKGELKKFIDQFSLHEGKILDIGCGRGWFKDLVKKWIGLDISIIAGQFSNGQFICGIAEHVPIKDACMDAIWSITFLEHSPDPEQVLNEIVRLLVVGGVLYLAPAWRVPPWRPKGYEVKTYRVLPFYRKLFKFIMPLMNFLWMHGFFWIPLRFIRELTWKLHGKRINLNKISFTPNFDEFLLPDSDAQNSIDNHEVLIWFLSRGFKTPEKTNILKRVFMRCGPVIVYKQDKLS